MRSYGWALIQYDWHPQKKRCLGHRGKTMWRTGRTQTSISEGERSQKKSTLLNTLILDFQPLELWENKWLLFKSPGLWYFVVAAWANWHSLQYSFSLPGHLGDCISQPPPQIHVSMWLMSYEQKCHVTLALPQLPHPLEPTDHSSARRQLVEK